MSKDIVCSKCNWSWDKDDSESHDMYVCHKCGNDNSKNENMSDKIKGGLSDKTSKQDIADKFNISLSDLDKEISMGIKIEMEHTDSKETAEEIAMDHLTEMPDYYTRLEDMEKKSEAHWKKKLKESVSRELKKLI